jgi:hypothetical protein
MPLWHGLNRPARRLRRREYRGESAGQGLVPKLEAAAVRLVRQYALTAEQKLAGKIPQ